MTPGLRINRDVTARARQGVIGEGRGVKGPIQQPGSIQHMGNGTGTVEAVVEQNTMPAPPFVRLVHQLVGGSNN